MTLYRIRDWGANFENNRTRDLDSLRWVPVPNKHDGEGYLTIMGEKDGIAIYGCWHLILQVASKCHPRGTLMRADGTPHTAASIALKTGWRRPADFQRALEFCASSQVGWLEADKSITAPECGNPAPDCVEGKEGKEGKESRQSEVAEAIQRWNSLAEPAGLVSIKLLSEKRAAKLAARLRSFPDFWTTLEREIPQLSDFAKGIGVNGSTWALNFDFCVESDGNVAKITEGNYRTRQQRTEGPNI